MDHLKLSNKKPLKIYQKKILCSIDTNEVLFDFQRTSLWSNFTLPLQNGSYLPSKPSRKLSVIIPFRDESESLFRFKQLELMLHYLTRYLIDQNTQFTVLVVNQISGKAFNRAKLFNIGFSYQVQKSRGEEECFVFHDVDCIAENSKFVYYCDQNHPLHLSAWLHEENYKPLYKSIMGGVTSFTREQFTSINGYSNEYWGWGAEDDDLSNRVRSYYNLERVPRPANKKDYHMYRMEHERDKNNLENPRRKSILKEWEGRWWHDGLNSLSDWKIIEETTTKYYVNLTVQI